MSEVPRLMCTQHPDSTVKVTAQMEVEEAIASFTTYGCDEVMVDYEGKLTPYSQPREVAKAAVEAGLPLGEGFTITVRLPKVRRG
jgi:phosphoenolpyruvate carboxylase